MDWVKSLDRYDDDYFAKMEATHTRFFTNSSMFNLPKPKLPKSGWVFIRSFYSFEEDYLSWLFEGLSYAPSYECLDLEGYEIG